MLDKSEINVNGEISPEDYDPKNELNTCENLRFAIILQNKKKDVQVNLKVFLGTKKQINGLVGLIIFILVVLMMKIKLLINMIYIRY